MKQQQKEDYPKTMTIPLTQRMWARLRKLSIDRDISMNELVRKAVQKMFKEPDEKRN